MGGVCEGRGRGVRGDVGGMCEGRARGRRTTAVMSSSLERNWLMTLKPRPGYRDTTTLYLPTRKERLGTTRNDSDRCAPKMRLDPGVLPASASCAPGVRVRVPGRWPCACVRVCVCARARVCGWMDGSLCVCVCVSLAGARTATDPARVAGADNPRVFSAVSQPRD